jgi:hypothetical protein
MAQRKAPRPPALAALLLLIAALACNLPGQGVTPVPHSTRTATISDLSGEVTVRQSPDGPETPAAPQQLLPSGAQIGTKGGAQATVLLPESGSFLRLGEDGALSVLELSSGAGGPVSRFGLLAGKTWVVLGAQGGEAVVETPGGMATGNGAMSVE